MARIYSDLMHRKCLSAGDFIFLKRNGQANVRLSYGGSRGIRGNEEFGRWINNKII